MNRIILFLVAFALTLSACSLPDIDSPTQTRSASPCGDGVCSGPENAQNCPADCPSTAAPTSSARGLETGASAAPAVAPGGEAPLFMTTMTHMEQGFTDNRDQNVFNLHVAQLRYGMDLADEYGAKLTIESEQPFARANTKWNLNVMAEILERGHGVGTHCDFGFREPAMSVEQYSQLFAGNKALVDALVGAENNLGCSGGGGANDWATAASMAGFKYLDGVVGMHYLSMPIEARPDSTWTDEYIRSEGFHDGAPVDLYQRIYPFMVADGRDFVPDENGVLLVSSGELGALAMMAEGSRCKNCLLTNSDVDMLVSLMRAVDQNRERGRVAKLAVYLPANIFAAGNEPVLRYFFSQMQALASEGVITWATQKEVYEAYVNWNK